jgi:hypothetical protein
LVIAPTYYPGPLRTVKPNGPTKRSIGIERDQPAQSAGIKPMCEVPLDPLSPVPLQTLAAIALNPPPVAVYRRLLRRLAEPVLRAAIGLGNVGSQFQLVQTKHDFVAVIPESGVKESFRTEAASACRA